jgi:streptogramin lyase
LKADTCQRSTPGVDRCRPGHRIAAILAICAAALFASPGRCAELSGRVIAVGDGRGVAGALVTLTQRPGARGASAITVYTGDDGSFTLAAPEVSDLEGASLVAHKLGYRQVQPAGTGPAPAASYADGRARIYLDAVADIGGQVPASAWLAGLPPGAERNIVVSGCSSCHQMASPRVREYAARIEAVDGAPRGSPEALQHWRQLVRHAAWRATVTYMRAKHYAVFPLESAMNLDAIDWPTTENPDYSFFSASQGEVIARYLATNFPPLAVSMPRHDYAYGAPLGGNSSTVIREFSLPREALVRELVAAPGSRYLWGADVRRNLILRLDPESGAAKWYPVDYPGSTGPHTIVPDDTGQLWVSMIDNDQFGRFDPVTERWTLWTLRPDELADDASIGGAAIVHDMSVDSRGHLARDPQGEIWVTLVGTNQMGTLNPDSGRVAFHDVNRIPGLSPINHLIYSTVLSADGACAWYSQVNGYVACMDTATKTVRKIVPFTEGTGPRRMTRDNVGGLWVALFGSGQVARIDMGRGEVVATYDLPDRAAAPYAVSWDEARQAIWVANANSDVIYRLDMPGGEIRVYPLPRQMAYLRQLSIREDSGDLVGTYGNYPEGSGPSMGVLIHPGD